jgi:hypothetical protein
MAQASIVVAKVIDIEVFVDVHGPRNMVLHLYLVISTDIGGSRHVWEESRYILNGS